jgi:hypothetical protein
VSKTLAEWYFETALVDDENGVPPPEWRTEHELLEG